MKKTLYFFAAITMAASSAMASKARVSALSSSPAVTDIQSIFTNPADVHYVGDFVTFEMGEKTANALSASDSTKFSTLVSVVPNAEGGFIQTMGDAKFGFYLGKMSSSTNTFRGLASYAAFFTQVGATPTASELAAPINKFLQQENPFEVFYGAKAGDLNWGASFTFSNSDMKNGAGTTDDQKQSAMGIRMGVKTDEWAAYANVGLGSEAKVGDAKFTGKSGVTVGGHYIMDNMKLYAKYDAAGAKATDSAGADKFDMDATETTVGFTNSWKNDGNLAFYGLAYKMNTTKQNTVGALNTLDSSSFVTGSKQDITSLPFTLGAEVLAASWLKLRGSISQNVLLGSNKVTDPTVPPTNERNDSIAHNTTTAAGAGFVWGHNVLDVVMLMGTNSTLDAATFGSNASYTYTF